MVDHLTLLRLKFIVRIFKCVLVLNNSEITHIFSDILIFGKLWLNWQSSNF